MCVKPALLQRGFFCFRSSQLEVWGQICWSNFFHRAGELFLQSSSSSMSSCSCEASAATKSLDTGSLPHNRQKSSRWGERRRIRLCGGGGHAAGEDFLGGWLGRHSGVFVCHRARDWLNLHRSVFGWDSVLAHLDFDWSENHIPTKSILSKN